MSRWDALFNVNVAKHALLWIDQAAQYNFLRSLLVFYRYTAFFNTLLICLSTTAPKNAHAQLDPFIGQLMLFGGNFCPRNWANADGQLLSIADNQALFWIFGTVYGGDGRTTFALPDLRGRAPIHVGTGTGLASVTQGQKLGVENYQLSTQNMPSHNHTVQASNVASDKGGPGGKLLGAASTPGVEPFVFTQSAPNRTMSNEMITHSGGDQAIPVRGPSVVLRWCVALQGIFPPRN